MSFLSKRDPPASSGLESFSARRETSGSLGLLGASRGGPGGPPSFGEELEKASVTSSIKRTTLDSPESDPLAVRQKQWDQQIAATEAKEAEVMHQQWKVIREQLAALTNNVASMQSEFKSMQAQVSKNQQDVQAEVSARTKLELTTKQVADEQANLSRAVQNEAKSRQESDDRLSRDLKQTEELINKTAQNLLAQQQEMKKVLSDEMNRHRLLQDEETRKRIAGDDDLQNQLNTLQRNLEATIGQHMRDLTTSVDNEIKARTQQGADLVHRLEELRMALEKEAMTRENKDADLRSEMGGFRQEVATEREQRISEDAALRKSIQAFEALLSQQMQEMRVLLEKEIANLRLWSEAEIRRISDANKGLSADLLRSLELETRERTDECARLFSHLQKVEARVDNEENERGAAVAELHRLRLLLAEELATEKRERANGDADLLAKVQELIAAVDREKGERTDEDGALRRLIQTMEANISQQIKSALELEIKERTAGDRQLEGLLTELQGALNGIRADLGTVQADLTSRLKLVADALDTEVKQRTQRDEENSRFALQVKRDMEAETRDRIAADDEAARRENDLAQALSREKEERQQADAELLRNIKAVETQAAKQAQDLKQLIDAEARDRVASDSDLDRRLAALRSELEAEARERDKGDQDVLRLLTQAVEKETQARNAETALLTAGIQKAMSSLEAETRDRIAGDDEGARRANDLAQALNREKEERQQGDAELLRQLKAVESQAAKQDQELKQLLDAEARDRVAGDSELERRLAALRSELEAEARERDKGDQDVLRLLTQALEKETQALLQQLRELKSSLDAETAARIAGDDRLEAMLQELRASLGAETAKGLGALREELDRALRKLAGDLDNLKAALKQEVDARIAGDEEANRAWVNPVQQLERALQQLREALAAEQAARAGGDDDLMRTLRTEVQQLQGNLGVLDDKLAAESRARQQADQAEADTRRKMFDEENRLREKGDDTVRNSIVPELQQLDSELRNLRSALEQEVRARAAAEAALSEAWKQALGEEARLRTKGDEDTARNFSIELQQLQGLMNSMRDSIDGDLRALQTRMDEDQQALKEEARLRQAGDQAQAEQIALLRQALQSEGQQRSAEDQKLADAIRNLESTMNDLFQQASAAAAAARDGVAALDGQLKDMAARVQQQLDTLQQALQREAAQREQGDRLLQDLLAGKAGKGDLDNERARAEQVEAELRALIDDLSGQLQRLKALTEDLVKNSGWKDEARRIWEAIDTHTHDLNVDTYEEEVKEVRPTVITTQRVVQQPQRIIQQPAVPTIFVEAHAPTVQTRGLVSAPSQPTLMLAGTVVPHVEYVAHAAGQVPFIEEIHLRGLQPAHLREHAMTLYRTLGHHRIGEAVPVYDEELLEWIMNVQRVHVSPLRVGGAVTTSGGTAMIRAASPPTTTATPPGPNFMMRSPRGTTRTISPPPAGFHQ